MGQGAGGTERPKGVSVQKGAGGKSGILRRVCRRRGGQKRPGLGRRHLGRLSATHGEVGRLLLQIVGGRGTRSVGRLTYSNEKDFLAA